MRTATPCLFRFRCPEAEAVFLIGSFNDWTTCATPMTRAADGTWEVSVRLPAGRHSYSYFVIESHPAMGRAAWLTSVANDRSVLCVPERHSESVAMN